ncbi:hypothetical protein J6590_026228 [Homalodisca vitripennis]|nr:hypothetical protein J6590_026227 [Homalodisca vitripennis]KAG8337267.1 hypothetical protein J6590_026228 [Homalodisca vitripennis]
MLVQVTLHGGSVQAADVVHKVLKVKEPQYLSKKLLYGEVSRLSSRQDVRLQCPKVRLEVGRTGFSYFGPSISNGLPEQVTSIVSRLSFKDKMKPSLINTNEF